MSKTQQTEIKHCNPFYLGMQKPISTIRNVDEVTNCEVCTNDIDYAGSKYVTESGEVVCAKCISFVRGSRDDQSYISPTETKLNSQGVMLLA